MRYLILIIVLLSCFNLNAQKMNNKHSKLGYMFINENSIELDKQAHFIAGNFIGVTTYTLYLSKFNISRKEAVIYSTLTGLFVGVLKEWSDSNKPNNKFDFEDLAYTVGGTLFITITLDLWRGEKIKNKR